MPTAHELLLLDEIGPDRFRARFNLDNHMDAAFGGQLLGQSLAAARRTVDEDRPASSLNGYFFKAGRPDLPIDYLVERTASGRRIETRRVTGKQRGRPIFGLQCSFHHLSEGPRHQPDAPLELAGPEDLPNLAQLAETGAIGLPRALADIVRRPFPIELRPVRADTMMNDENRDLWFRMPTAASVESGVAHESLLALMSDYWLPGSITARHGNGGRGGSLTSLNHSLWLHGRTRVDEWLLYRTSSPWGGNGRGLAAGRIFDRAGMLVATVMQEALLLPAIGPNSATPEP